MKRLRVGVTLRDVDTIVFAIGRRSNDALYHALRERLPTFRIGDCRAPRFLEHAIYDGDAIGRDLEARLAAAGRRRLTPCPSPQNQAGRA